MSDPAVEAARRAHPSDCPGCTEILGEVAAAREALAPIRELHRPVDGRVYRYCAECYPYGSIDNTEWPCATARLVYSEGEM